MGNTGHSTEPHLHVQLMDRADFLSANALPIWFSDVPRSVMGEGIENANSLAGSDLVLLPD